MTNKDFIEILFPNILSSGYSITSPETGKYNCIAWSVVGTDAWWWPDSENLGYWPSKIPREETLGAFIKAYESLNFAICQDDKLEENFEKIAIYVNKDNKPTHAARQLRSGRWTSKLGELEDIQHTTLDGLYDSDYGKVAVIMKRPL